jgi:hypothetical protein
VTLPAANRSHAGQKGLWTGGTGCIAAEPLNRTRPRSGASGPSRLHGERPTSWSAGIRGRRRLKRRLRPIRGKLLRSARVICAGSEFFQNLRRGHYELGVDVDLSEESPRPGPPRLGGAPNEVGGALRGRGNPATTTPAARPSGSTCSRRSVSTRLLPSHEMVVGW